MTSSLGGLSARCGRFLLGSGQALQEADGLDSESGGSGGGSAGHAHGSQRPSAGCGESQVLIVTERVLMFL